MTRKGLVLVWTGRSTSRRHRLDVEDTEDYSCAPLETVAYLIKEVAARDNAVDETGEFAWWLGARLSVVERI